MNIKKNKITLLLSASIFLAMPLSNTFADQKQHETHDMQMEDAMQNIKDELRAYVESVKSDDTQKMQQHVDTLLNLSTIPAMDHSNMNHSDMPMNHAEMTNETMDHDMSTMENMEGMSMEQHQHMIYMHEMTQFNDLFKSLDKVQDKAEISVILGKIKEQIKNSNE